MMINFGSSVRTTLYAVFTLMLAAFATLGGVSVSETRVLRDRLFVAGASSDAIGGLRELERATDEFLRGEAGPRGQTALARFRQFVHKEGGALRQLADAIDPPEQADKLRRAASSLASLDERIEAIAASRPLKQSAEARVRNGAARINTSVGEANSQAADIALDFEGDRAVHEGPFKRVARMSGTLSKVDAALRDVARELDSSGFAAAAEPSRLERIARHLARLRFQTPEPARPEQQRLETEASALLKMFSTAAAGGVPAPEAFKARFEAVAAAGNALRAAAVSGMNEAAAGLEKTNEINRRIDWTKLELGRAAINANALVLAAERFVDAPSRGALDTLEKALKAVMFRLRAATADADEFVVVAKHVAAAEEAGREISGALETVLRLSSEEERFRKDAETLIGSIEGAAIEVVRLLEDDTARRSETALVTVAIALGLGVLAWVSGLFMARNRLLLPFRGLTRAMERLAKGDLTAASEGANRRDEIGAMARAMEVFRGNALKVQNLRAERDTQELARRAQIEALLEGIKVLNDEESIPAMFDGVLRTLSRLVEFDAAAILVEDRKRRFVALASTSAEFRPEIEAPEAGEDGRCVMEELALLEDSDYRLASRIKGLGYRSALLAPLNAHSRRAMMVCARREKGVYGDSELSAVKAFTPIAEQAVRNAEQLDELEDAVRELDEMAHHDVLTGLKNRKSFINEINRRKASVDQGQDTAFALFHIDLDHFKVINDAIGHAAGDYALNWAAREIEGSVRAQDVVARLGGDEFAVICEETDDGADALVAIAEKLGEKLSAPFEYEGKSLQMGASIGIGRFPVDSDDPGEILHIADMALLEAKASGRGRYAFFTLALRRELDRRQTMEFKLHDAMVNGELELWYQPIVSLKTRRVESFEALVRWRNSKFGLIEPSDFIPVAERAGLMGKIGEWVIRTACHDLKPWLAEGESRRVAVNVAAAQLSSPDFVAVIDEALREEGLRPRSVELELSEEITLRRSAELALDNLMALHERGYQIAFDDFGTGYTSLAHLRRFPGQRMKIDRSFVAGCNSGAAGGADPALTRGLFVLAQSLGMSVVAEGVESAAQLAFCEEIGCDEAQGYLFGKPMPLEEALIRAARIDSGEFEVWTGDGRGDAIPDAMQAEAS